LGLKNNDFWKPTMHPTLIPLSPRPASNGQQRRSIAHSG